MPSHAKEAIIGNMQRIWPQISAYSRLWWDWNGRAGAAGRGDEPSGLSAGWSTAF